MEHKLTGLIAAPFTPMHADGSLNPELIARQAHWLAAHGVRGAFVCGTTGEGVSLTTQERLQVAERWVAASEGKLRIIVHVGHNSVEESRSLAAHAERVGAQAVACTAPCFFRPESTEQLAAFCARVAGGAPSLPFYFYHMPALTNVDPPMLEFLRYGSKRIPNLAGVKFTDDNMMAYSQSLNFEGGRFNILFGRDEILLSALALGGTGAVGSTYNFMAPLYHKMITAFESGDLPSARRYQALAVDIIALMNRHGGLPAGKFMMKLIGLDCGPVRLPLRNLTPDECENLERQLEGLGFPLKETSSDAGRPGERAIQNPT